jgi:hypothetical protein
MNLIGRMKFAAQTQSSLLCLWRKRAALHDAFLAGVDNAVDHNTAMQHDPD